MILKAKKKARGFNPDGVTQWEAKKGDLVEMPDRVAERRLAIEPDIWEAVSGDQKPARKKGGK